MTGRSHPAAWLPALVFLLGGCGEPTDDSPADQIVSSEAADAGEPPVVAPTPDAPQDPASEPHANRLGVVTLDDTASRTIASAVFTILPDDQSAADVARALSAPGDHCEPLDDGPLPSTISAGETLVLTARSGTWATAERIVDGAFISYAANTATDRAPAGVDVQVQGDDFPAIQVQAPSAPPLPAALAARVGEPITRQTPLSWVATRSDARLELVVNVEQAAYLCSLDDDGEATLAGLIDAANAPLTIRSLSRVHREVVGSQTAALVVERRASAP